MNLRPLIFILPAVALIAFAVMHPKKPKLTPAEYIEQVHKDVAVSTMPEWQCVGPKDTRSPNCPVVEDATPAHTLPRIKPKYTHKRIVEKKHARPLPRPRPHVDQAPVETLPKSSASLPPQQGTICIFPFNMIPRCTPGANADAGRD